MKINFNEVHRYDISYIVSHVPKEHSVYFSKTEIPKEHYRLLLYISNILKDKKILDLGTYIGTSALCLAYNGNNKIVSVDSKKQFDDKYFKNLKNIEFIEANCSEFDFDYFNQFDMIMLDIDHTGKTETKIYNLLKDNGYKGLLLLDDIYLNIEMINFWQDIDITKYDLTEIGHVTGTGIVDFGNILEVIE